MIRAQGPARASRLGDISNARGAFHAARLVMCAIFAISVLAGGTASRQGWAPFLGVLIAAIGFMISITYLWFRFAAKTSVDRTNPADRIPAWLLILIDSVLALGIILGAGASSAPLAWVALVIPVTEAALFYSLLPAAAVWLALSLAHMSFVVNSYGSAALDDSSEALLLAAQQLLAVLLVAVPAAMLLESVRHQIEALTADRRRAREQNHQLESVAIAAQKMSSLNNSQEVMRQAVINVVAIGFEEADVVTREADGTWKTLVRHHEVASAPVPEHLLSDEAVANAGIATLTPDTDEARQDLHLVSKSFGCAEALETDGYAGPVVMRAWMVDAPLVDTEPARAFSLLAHQVANIHTNAVSTERAALESARLFYEAAHDPLTGAANHGNIMETLEMLRHTDDSTSVFFVDLDRFKPINDTLGHEAGNRALRIISRRLEELIELRGTVGRMGGDEFIVVGETAALAGPQGRLSLANTIFDTICEPMSIDGHVVSVGASVGATFGDSSLSPDELVRRADVAMYTAKRLGGGAVAWHDELEQQQSGLFPSSNSRDLGDEDRALLDEGLPQHEGLSDYEGLPEHEGLIERV